MSARTIENCSIIKKCVKAGIGEPTQYYNIQLIMLYYLEGYTLEKCSELMSYSKRQIERIKREIDEFAFFSLLKIAADDSKTQRLLKIKNILSQEI